MQTRKSLALADARTLIEGARRMAETHALGVCVAVVDHAGVLIACERLDDARLHTPDVAARKARTAAITRTPTASLQKLVKEDPSLLAFPDRLPIEGGVPILVEGAVVGGIGCSGGTSDEDAMCCEAGINAWTGS